MFYNFEQFCCFIFSNKQQLVSVSNSWTFVAVKSTSNVGLIL